MTEAEWLAGEDPKAMIDFLVGKTSGRKFRLLACAYLRSQSHLLIDERSRHAIEVIERYVEGLASEDERTAAHRTARELAFEDTLPDKAHKSAAACASVAASHNLEYIARFAADHTMNDAEEVPPADLEARRRIFVALAHCVFGNPFRPAMIDPRWLTSTVVDLARSIYEADPRQAGGYMRMPILADALMDAGCDDEVLLNHCRGDGPHARGCWVVDLILGKG